MRKFHFLTFFFTFLCFYLCFCCFTFAFSENASLRTIQNGIMKYMDYVGSPQYTITGEVFEIEYIKDDLRYIYVAVDEEKALSFPESPRPYFVGILWVGYNISDVPCSVGDTVTITGTLNYMYSSVMVPWLHVDIINGQSIF